jgi:hexosaminidase
MNPGLRTNILIYLFAGPSLLLAPTITLHGGNASPLLARGYTVVPTPQKVSLDSEDFPIDEGWRLEIGRGVDREDIAAETLQEDLATRFHLHISTRGAGREHAGIIRLEEAPNSVNIGQATDRNSRALAEQAYRLDLKPHSIAVKANAPQGLFYGVQTLVQLVRAQGGKLWLPAGEIVDWPDLEMRIIYWDDAHHLEHPEALKAALRQAAFYKINGFAIKLEGHFQYAHAAPIVEPYALAPAELQELTDYGLRYHVQVIPYLDGPAHVAFILKHPEYAKLREFPESNYEFCATNPDTYQLLFGMYQDLLDANQGSKYFVLSTDEPYYVGLAKNDQCDEASRAKELGSVGKLLAEFTTKTADYLHDRGRTVLFWGEYPLRPEDIRALPSHLVNGETYGLESDPVYKAHGIRQMVYTSTEGEEMLFPNYYLQSSGERLHPRPTGAGRVSEMFNLISFTSARQQADLIGAFIAGWADMGLHPEAFWLGYVTGPAAAWHPGSPDPAELMSSFYSLFYGPSGTNMGRLYQLMSEQAQFWEDSWETTPSNARTPIFGNSYGIFTPPRPAHDYTLPVLSIPSPRLLTLSFDWGRQNAKRLKLAAKFLAQNDELLDLLNANLSRVEFNRYNLEVLLSDALLCRQNLLMLLDLGRIDERLKSVQAAAGGADPRRAVADLDRALNIAESIRQHRNQVLQDTIATWYKSWFPRVAEANGRRYLDKADDVKDHLPVRTVDMSYLVYRELLYPLGEWAEQVRSARNDYARAYHLPVREQKFDWKDTNTVVSVEPTNEEDE